MRSEQSDEPRYTLIDRDAQRAREDIPESELDDALQLVLDAGHSSEIIDQEEEISTLLDPDGERIRLVLD